MKHFFITTKIEGNVSIEEHGRYEFYGNKDVKYTLNSAKKEYLTRLKTLSNELIQAIDYIENDEGAYIPPVLLKSQHGCNNQDIDDMCNTTTFSEIG